MHPIGGEGGGGDGGERGEGGGYLYIGYGVKSGERARWLHAVLAYSAQKRFCGYVTLPAPYACPEDQVKIQMSVLVDTLART